jgi:predicted metalloprotease with PDZ domain
MKGRTWSWSLALLTGAALALPASAAWAGPRGGEGLAPPVEPPTSEEEARTEAKAGGGAFLGIYMQSLDEDLAEAMGLDVEEGVLVDDLVDDGPAEKAGLKAGDVIVKLDGRGVESSSVLRDLLGRKAPGDEVNCVVLRDGDEQTVTVVLGEPRNTSFFAWSDDEGSWPSVMVGRLGGGSMLGVAPHDLGEELGDYFDVDRGVLVLDVSEDGAAEKAGLEAGDVILGIDGEDVENTEGLREILGEHEGGDEVKVELMRHGRRKTVQVELQDSSFRTFARSFQQVRPHMMMSPDRNMRHWRYIGPGGRDEIEELREEIKELRRELEKLKD